MFTCKLLLNAFFFERIKSWKSKLGRDINWFYIFNENKGKNLEFQPGKAS